MPSPPDDLPTRLMAWRWSVNLSQKKLAVRAGCCQASVAQIEVRGFEPSIALLKKLISKGLGIDWVTFWSTLPHLTKHPPPKRAKARRAPALAGTSGTGAS
jgi:transcriptional regulator with XRE-family HTH domain